MDNHETLPQGGAAVAPRLRHHHRCRGGQFPAKLYALLELSAGVGGARLGAHWLPHGRAFRVSDEGAFMTGAVPLFFRQTKFRSFCRQLNLWGFRRIPRGVDAGTWYHEHFHRDDPGEMQKMFRTIVKGTTKNKPPGKDEDDATPPSPLLPAPASTEGRPPSGEGTSGNDDRGGGPRGRRRVTLEEASSSHHPIVAALALSRSDLPPRRAEAPSRLRPSSSPRPVVSPTPSPVGLNQDQDTDIRRSRQRGGSTGASSDDAFSRMFRSFMGQTVGEAIPPPFGASSPGTAPPIGGTQGGSTAGPAPWPFSSISSEGGGPFPFEGRDEGPSAAAGLEPLPFEAEPPLDELAGYIDRVIQMV